MRKARRAADQPDLGAPYPYGYPPGPTEQPMPGYDVNMGGPMYNTAPPMNYYPQPGPSAGADQFGFHNPTQLLQNPAVANLAMQYVPSLVNQGKEVLDREVNKYISTSRIKYYFSVDTAYVAKKLALILFPFTHQDWSVKYNPEEPLQPRYELNAPDLYIPAMAFVTYVLAGGISLGLQNRFTPEVLGMQASTAMVWAIIEILAVWLSLYIMNIQTNLSLFDILAFTSYKYVGMIVVTCASFLMPSAYHFALIYVSVTLMFFMVRSLKVQILPESSHDSQFSRGSKRRTYLLLLIAVFQPLLMWWLTRHLAYPHTSVETNI